VVLTNTASAFEDLDKDCKAYARAVFAVAEVSMHRGEAQATMNQYTGFPDQENNQPNRWLKKDDILIR